MKSDIVVPAVLVANTFAADGYVKTGSASYEHGASAPIERTHSDSFDKTGTAIASRLTPTLESHCWKLSARPCTMVVSRELLE